MTTGMADDTDLVRRLPSLQGLRPGVTVGNTGVASVNRGEILKAKANTNAGALASAGCESQLFPILTM